VADRALAIAAMALGDSAAALEHIRRALRAAERAGLTRRAAEARMTLSFIHGFRGDGRRALAAADRAAGGLHGLDAARLAAQRALILQRLGRADEALAAYRRALPVLRRHADRVWEARLLCNRGVLYVYRGALASAERDLRAAARICDEIGATYLGASVQHNLGFTSARRGAVPEALTEYDGADARYAAAGASTAPLLLDRAELLLSVRWPARRRRPPPPPPRSWPAVGWPPTSPRPS
jgi:tetratricopeptide (TPR) repeat protein